MLNTYMYTMYKLPYFVNGKKSGTVLPVPLFGEWRIRTFEG